MRTNTIAGIALFAAGCIATDAPQKAIDVTQPNELGVVTLTIDPPANGDRGFVLRGLDVTGETRASVSLRTGVVDNLRAQLPGDDDYGTEILVSGGTVTQFVTRESELFHLPVVADPVARGLIELAEVSATLERNAVVPVRSEAPVEVGLSTQACPSSYLNASPLAKQACYTTYSQNWTTFIDPNGDGITRIRNPHGTACKGSNGTDACNGTSCYFGPNAFARPTKALHGSAYGRVESSGGVACTIIWYGSPQVPIFGDVGGQFPTNQNCPGGDGGSNSTAWDY